MGAVVVTGAAGALGEVLVGELVARGHRVGAVDRPAARDRLDALAARHAGRCVGVPLDVSSATPEEWARALGSPDCRALLGESPDGAVLVAGGWRGGAPLHAEADDSVWTQMFAANLETAHKTLRALLPGMVRQRRGSVVVIGSRAVERPWTSAGASAYAASKSALVTLACTVSAEVLDLGVRVNAVLPSTIDTAQNRKAMPDVDPSRWVSPASLSAVIAFLLSEDARDVSGAAIPVYGRA